ncbi:bifunctional arginine demethylase and lysyl-hydroxylase PSR [Eurytemora carolleeae]|uniref:bifunctional arginine demethylase and lysyl-hydroxylase PSR n=1 Tax=Eurytemora carolleeae TaxID=1294199 RepID=UPI000C77533B|nr:bifunctional arginine demethylase and lysyl-hydroxylase PSR [Eurytemora carolleeae]XP_023349546.1 bifunctional arginine demethylase and lysyl-hydroxylase PSR [Eurytemora carolleeae]XP_023349548.1 bifunctional arginine demethylase and lysyl-hydroxylase PSR [Eurytemora carolleeae]XP_023349549.1 bifunctional arginine demethylase and lysyl-hydroxylase PSR [Eurytemora carolleeae]XP_023349550.1 bifunctional arginine demethylase and lysyl-hydroxylase PSR [Eurytemora carolleeae]|eukprot:XP_023349545.1 bifunctional arginine demethylase and lysyl-hydroxylase PSR-like [Eurytemora affinis]
MMNWIDVAVARRNIYYENIKKKSKIIYKIISIYLSIYLFIYFSIYLFKFSYSGLLQMPLVDTRKVYDEVKDDLDRLDCSDKTLFTTQYMVKQKPVILVNCSGGWLAHKKWTFDYLFDYKEGEVHWVATYMKNLTIVEEEDNNILPTGTQLRQIYKNGGLIRIFEQLKKRTNLRYELKQHRKKKDDKGKFFEEYSQPSAILLDVFNQTGIKTDFQWMMVASKNTGTGLHLDIHNHIRTAGWNTIILGYKWWVFFPVDVNPSKLLCDPGCSQNVEHMSQMSWFTHILPQIRTRSFYGKKLIEAIQGPEETVYLPGFMAHAVMNLEDNIAIGENLILEESVFDYIYGVMLGDYALNSRYRRKH